MAAVILTAGPPVRLSAQFPPANRAVYLDKEGVIRWKDDRSEVTLYGANYVLPTASDYRAAGYLHADRKAMISEDMAQFARMGWDGMRLTFWGDWEASDSAGNLIDNDHLDLLDWQIATGRERGIYMLFSPIQLYGSNWPDALNDTTQPGFGRKFGKGRMGTDPAAIAAQVNYLRQILNHVNRYTHVALKNEPAILFIELVNEPWHHPEDRAGSIRYLNALTDAVRSTGCRKLIFYNVSQDFAIGGAIRASRVQGLTFGWYPTGLVSGHELTGNYLRGVDDYPPMRDSALARLPRIVYEFDSPDLRSGTMYPAMARTFRSVGTQFAAMFAYDFLATASRNLGWQTHYLNLVYTPRKAMSAIIAAEAMRRLPRGEEYGGYPRNTTFGSFHISADSNLAELLARDAFMYAGSTADSPPAPGELKRIAGYGSSPLVQYGGEGIYFLDQVKPGVWRLEVYPDAVPVHDPFEQPRPDKVVTRAIRRAWPMTVTVPDLGATFTVQALGTETGVGAKAEGGRFTVTPGVYVLSAGGAVDPSKLPRTINRVGLAEYHAPPLDTMGTVVTPLWNARSVGRANVTLSARVVDAVAPDSVVLTLHPQELSWGMHATGPYEYSAEVTGMFLPPNRYQPTIEVFRGASRQQFPDPALDSLELDRWQFDRVNAGLPLPLFTPERDAARLTFSRIGDAGRRGLFRLTDAPGHRQAFHFELPIDRAGNGLPDYTASIVIRDPIRSLAASISAYDTVQLNIRALGTGSIAYVTLMEDDGTSWSAPVDADSGWKWISIPLTTFRSAKGVLLPEGFPGEWNYWVGPAEGRGGAGDRPRLDHLERLQISLRPAGETTPTAHAGVEIAAIELR